MTRWQKWNATHFLLAEGYWKSVQQCKGDLVRLVANTCSLWGCLNKRPWTKYDCRGILILWHSREWWSPIFWCWRWPTFHYKWITYTRIPPTTYTHTQNYIIGHHHANIHTWNIYVPDKLCTHAENLVVPMYTAWIQNLLWNRAFWELI